MSQSTQRIMQSHVKAKLRKLCARRGTGVSAGEVAKETGMSRTTAKKHLETLAAEARITVIETVHVNNQKMTLYYAGMEG